MIITAFMPVRFFAETSTFSVSPSSRLPFETTVLPKSPRPQDPKTKTPQPRSINCAGKAELLTETCGVTLTGNGFCFSEAQVAMKVCRLRLLSSVQNLLLEVNENVESGCVGVDIQQLRIRSTLLFLRRFFNTARAVPVGLGSLNKTPVPLSLSSSVLSGQFAVVVFAFVRALWAWSVVLTRSAHIQSTSAPSTIQACLPPA